MAISTSLKAIDARRFGMREARHLLRRAGFDATGQQVQAVADMGLDKAVDLIVNYESVTWNEPAPPDIDPDVVAPPSPELRQKLLAARRSGNEEALAELQRMRSQQDANDRRQIGTLRNWWLARMISSPRPLEESLTLLWHGHFATGYRAVRDTWLLYKQNEMFREHASGRFADLAHGIVRDPAMLRYLNNNRSSRRKPNENLARELMELFTLGEGNYSEQDIKEGARALTGHTYVDNDYTFARRLHDDGSKTILGETGRFDGNDFVDILLGQDACPRFVAYKLYKHFVADTGDRPGDTARAAILNLSKLLKPPTYDLAPAIATLLKSEHFYEPSIIGNKIKSPAQLVVGAARSLGTPTRSIAVLVDAMSTMGQTLFEPPTVAGWDGGRAWINTSTLFMRQNLCAYMIAGKLPSDARWSTSDIDYDPMHLVEGVDLSKPDAIVDHLLATMIACEPPVARRKQLVDALADRTGAVSEQTIVGLLLLITATPEYQLC